ncbi:signal peptidase II [Neolewinella lacunae]|uniref:Lipoprotein signal peptidase n=1 Tax=Neolewinella lacunae TaxID=1517758 RepID=A0A923T722_9BACT|nr:signal peptidase II [Neolewinella lacunae]MBC6993114.1 signal peptidase II [Neolewinella lacunae]MDN3635934.1 signal peptidase II [Neolewinella lacunae]
MNQLKSRIIALTAAVGLTVGLDQWTKQLALNHLQGQPDVYYLNEILRLTFVRNTGAFLSLGSDLGPVLRPLLLNAFPAILLIALLVYIFREKSLNLWQTVALSLIVGGGLSNIIDRLLYGHVVDMLHLRVGSLQTGIFNVADMAIMAGMFMMLPFVFRKDPEKPQVAQEAEA